MTPASTPRGDVSPETRYPTVGWNPGVGNWLSREAGVVRWNPWVWKNYYPEMIARKSERLIFFGAMEFWYFVILNEELFGTSESTKSQGSWWVLLVFFRRVLFDGVVSYNTKVTHFFVVIIVEIFFDKKTQVLGSLFIKNSMVGFNHQHRQHLNCLAWFNHFGSNTWICCVFFCDFLSANDLTCWFGFLGWPVGKGLFPKGSP